MFLLKQRIIYSTGIFYLFIYIFIGSIKCWSFEGAYYGELLRDKNLHGLAIYRRNLKDVAYIYCMHKVNKTISKINTAVKKSVKVQDVQIQRVASTDIVMIYDIHQQPSDTGLLKILCVLLSIPYFMPTQP